MDRACDHSAMRSVSHFQPFARAEARSWKVPPFRWSEWRTIESARMLGVPVVANRGGGANPQANRRDAVTL